MIARNNCEIVGLKGYLLNRSYLYSYASYTANATHISKHKTKKAICALSACESTPIELNCVKNSS